MEQGRFLEGEHLEKFNIKLKSKPKDGVILQLHHTVRGSKGENHRIRFSLGTFDDAHEKLACADTLGNIFILDFTDLKFWKLNSFGTCTALHFVPNKEDILIVANADKYNIAFVDVENAKISMTLDGHTAPIKHISFSNNKANNLLTASPVEAILWELKNYSKYFTLNTYLGAQIQQILFTPGGDYLVACFQNDTIQIWKNETMKSVKQIIPSDLKHMKNIAFTMNGRAMAMAGLTPTLILFSMDTWKALKSIDLSKYGINGAQQIAFIPQVFDGGANKILAILSSDCTLRLFDVESLVVMHNINPASSGIKRFVVSPTGKYFLCILQLGEVNIYNSSYVIDTTQNPIIEIRNNDSPSTSVQKYVLEEETPSKDQVEHKMRVCMDSARLRRILMQYGEYPEKFRSVIWRSLLNTPRNKHAYASLIDKGIHPAYKDIEKQFTIHSSATLKNLKRLLSCLAHWCPLFGVMKFLPGFVFPFVKVLQKDPLLLFECVATVLINYCQLWFEYAPFPPISILAMVENILGEHDPQLLNHFCEFGVTSQIYALKILETAFSEVLTCSEWLILWDHILSNEPAYILMSVVSYSIVQKNALKKLKTHEQFENFYHMQNPIDKKLLLKKAYILLSDTAEDIHPKKFFNPFTSLEKGDCYQQFTGYPKATICMKIAKKNRNKLVPSDTCSLRNLTVKSQEKMINATLNSTDAIESKDTSDDGSSDDSGEKRHEKRKQEHNIQVFRKNQTETIFPVSVHKTKRHQKSKCNTKESSENSHKHSSRPKTKKKTDKKNRSLEKEVEKLLERYANSDLSDN
ncbi:TBC1 domain family member 31 [Plodia interpunctella]|uniref:TBC1 domain family member 31 n=1 Tax=Plodia interpunctella TaxID=58824 RepID=UPI0023676539|nr:TBC1 domain family member 31 [Plodia interpunctella]